MADIKVGDEVRVFDSTYWAGKSGMPPGGWVGEVIKITPKQVHVKYGEIGRVDIFKREGQRIAYGDIGRRFRTLQQAADDERRATAMHILREHRIKLEDPPSFTLDQIESLAEVVKGWDQEAGQ